MSNNGFEVFLTLNTNKDSFEQGRKSIDGVAIGVTNLLGTVRTAVPLIAAGLAGINATTSETAAASASIGFSVKQYEAWGIAAKQCKVNADALYSGMERLESIRVRIKHGDAGAADSLAQPLGWLGINDLKSFIDQDPVTRVSQVFAAAQEKLKSGAMDLREASDTVGSVLGSEFGSLFMNERTLGRSFFSLVNGYYRDSYMDEGAVSKAMGFNKEVNDTLYLLKQMGEFAGAEFGGAFTDMLKTLNEFLRENKDNIKSGLEDLATAISKVIDAMKPIASGVFKTSAQIFSDFIKALDAMSKGDWKSASKSLSKVVDTIDIQVTNALVGNDVINTKTPMLAAINADKKLKSENPKIREEGEREKELTAARDNINLQVKKLNNAHSLIWDRVNKDTEIPAELLNAARIFQSLGGDLNELDLPAEYVKKLQQAINGQSMNVDKNVQKAMHGFKNVSALTPDLLETDNLARSFLPFGGNTINSGGNIINQNITINGAADVASAVREEAYRGVNEGLMGTLNASQQRLQLITGLS